MTNSDTVAATIPAHSERQAMDWSLVLASQDIPTTIDRTEDNRWQLLVDLADRERALQAIRQYRLENRRWAWRQTLPGSDLVFHWGGPVCCLLLAIAYWLSAVELPGIIAAARFDSAAVARGEWWRPFTAVLLHADLAHLLTNTATGVVLFGLAMARYGAGCGLLAAYLSGAAGNFAGLLLYPRPYHGLGASGMVMGALGLMAVPAISAWRPGSGALKQLLRGTVAAVMLFVVLGTNPSSDVIAHAGGFAAGLLFGLVFNLLPTQTLQKKGVVSASWFVLGFLFTLTGGLALWRR